MTQSSAECDEGRDEGISDTGVVNAKVAAGIDGHDALEGLKGAVVIPNHVVTEVVLSQSHGEDSRQHVSASQLTITSMERKKQGAGSCWFQ